MIRLFFVFFLFLGASVGSKADFVDPFTPFDTNGFIKDPYGLDEEGIIFVDYKGRYGVDKYYNATFAAAYVNALYRDYKRSGHPTLRESIVKNVEHIISLGVVDETGAYWPYSFSNDHFDAPAGWYSGMTNGRVLSSLVAAHDVTKDQKYLDLAKLVFKKLILPLERGGMTSYDSQGPFIEEVAWFPNAVSHKVLNGAIFGLAGVYNYSNYTDSKEAFDFLESHVASLSARLDQFDSGFISYYSVYNEGKIPSFAERGGYNVAHIHQMLWLYSISNDYKFLEKAISFASYEYFKPDISASFSTNDKTHGPSKMDLTFGRNYWSSYSFPVTVKWDFDESVEISSITILGHTQKSSPKKLYVEAFDGSSWYGVARQINNSRQRNKIPFTYNVKAESIRLKIDEDNGNGAVALDGLGVELVRFVAPVVNFASFRSSFYKLRDGDQSTYFTLTENGWLLVPKYKDSSVVAISTVNKCDNLVGFSSSDLENWIEVDVDSKDQRYVVSSNDRYIKFVVKECALSISEVSVNG